MMKFDPDREIKNSHYSVLALEENKDTELNEFAGYGALKVGLQHALKSAGLSIPGVDLILGSLIAGYNLTNVAAATSQMIESLPIVGDNIIDKLSESDDEWKEVMTLVQRLPPIQRNALMEPFDKLLLSLKDFVITAIQTYDSTVAAPAAAAAGAASAGTGAVAVEAGTNLTTAVGGFIGGITPIEKFIFSFASKFAGALSAIFDFFTSTNPDKVEEMQSEGGPVLSTLIMSPLQTFSRLGELYNALHNPGQTALTPVLRPGAEKLIQTIVPEAPLAEHNYVNKFIGKWSKEYRK